MFASIEAKLIGFVVAFLAIASLMFGIFMYGKHVQKTKDDLATANLRIASDKLIQDAQTKNDALKQGLEKDHENSVSVINTLLAVQPPRVSIPKCASAGEVKPTTGSIQGVAASGVVSTEVERILDSGRLRVKEIVGAAEVELADCRIIKSWAAKQ